MFRVKLVIYARLLDGPARLVRSRPAALHLSLPFAPARGLEIAPPGWAHEPLTVERVIYHTGSGVFECHVGSRDATLAPVETEDEAWAELWDEIARMGFQSDAGSVY